MNLLKLLFALIIIAFVAAITIGNLQPVTLVVYPFEGALTLPLILALYIVLVIGVIAGGLLSWFGGIPTRVALKVTRDELAKLKAQQIEKAAPSNIAPSKPSNNLPSVSD